VRVTDIIQLAKKLGESIANSDEMRMLKKAEAAVELNSEAKDIFVKYQEAKLNNIRYELIGQGSSNVFAQIEKKAMENPLVADLIKKQESFNNLIKTVNAVMAHSIEKTPVTGCFRECSHDCGKCKEGVFSITHGYTDDDTVQRDKK